MHCHYNALDVNLISTVCVRVHEAPAEQLRGFKCYELQHDGSFHAVFLDQSGLLLSLLSNGLI